MTSGVVRAATPSYGLLWRRTHPSEHDHTPLHTALVVEYDVYDTYYLDAPRPSLASASSSLQETLKISRMLPFPVSMTPASKQTRRPVAAAVSRKYCVLQKPKNMHIISYTKSKNKQNTKYNTMNGRTCCQDTAVPTLFVFRYCHVF